MIIGLIVGVVALVELSFIAHADSPTKASSDLFNQIANSKLDPLGNEQMRESVQGAYQSPLGTQVHPSCFPKFESSRAKKIFYDQIDVFLARALKSVVYDCRNKYPQLETYLYELLSQMRRAVIICYEGNEKNLIDSNTSEFQGYSISDYENLKQFPEKIWKGLAPPIRSQRYALSHEPIIGMNRHLFEKLDPSDEHFGMLVDVLTHELLHQTSANNRDDHVKIEKQLADETRVCSSDIVLDRVTMVSHLCSGEVTFSNGHFASEVFYKRVSSCWSGNLRGCTDTFTSAGNTLSFTAQFDGLFSRDLSESNARVLCKKIINEGYCALHAYSVLGSKSEEFNNYKKRLLASFEKLAPRASYELAGSVIKAFPSIQKNIEEMFEKNPCFRAIVSKNSEGSLFLTPAALKVRVSDDLSFYNGSLELSTEKLQKTVDRFSKRVLLAAEFSPVKACVNNELHKQIRDVFYLLSLHTARIEHSKFYQALHELAFVDFPNFNKIKSYEQDWWTFYIELSGLFDLNVLNDFYEILDHFHPRSPKFSCEKYGLFTNY